MRRVRCGVTGSSSLIYIKVVLRLTTLKIEHWCCSAARCVWLLLVWVYTSRIMWGKRQMAPLLCAVPPQLLGHLLFRYYVGVFILKPQKFRFHSIFKACPNFNHKLHLNSTRKAKADRVGVIFLASCTTCYRLIITCLSLL